MAKESEEGGVEGWVEVKRTADQIEDTITVGLGAQDDPAPPRSYSSASATVVSVFRDPPRFVATIPSIRGVVL